ncbi:hypothetical protein Tco_0086941 [Tanacetum coccineum]
MAMTIQYGVRGIILAAQSEAFKQENVLAERLHGKKKWNSSVGSTLSPLRLRMDDFPVVLADAAERMLKTTMDLSLLLQHLKQIDQVKYDPDFWEDITEGMCY